MSITRAIPRWSPAKVLDPPDRTLLRCSDGNRFFPCGVVVDDESKRPKGKIK